MEVSYQKKSASADIQAYRDLIEHHGDAEERTSAIDLGDTAEEQIERYRQSADDTLREGGL